MGRAPAKTPHQRIEIELCDSNKDEPDEVEGESLKVHITDAGALLIYVGNERRQIAYAPGRWHGYEVKDIV